MAGNMFHMVFFTSDTANGWNVPWSGRTETEWRKPRCWQDLGRALEDACFDAIVPALQKRGAMRTGYEGKTFRENLPAL
ncbi:hypothetical protein [Novosphingobium resinovorum]|uniref:hypothetical protein n=1 Tax=Novosphingobium resinovorum TaxID=158500 RepID=UPI002ED5FA46|nr:hypothetical protein [Novosphingobium resinovorum]